MRLNCILVRRRTSLADYNKVADSPSTSIVNIIYHSRLSYDLIVSFNMVITCNSVVSVELHNGHVLYSRDKPMAGEIKLVTLTDMLLDGQLDLCVKWCRETVTTYIDS